MIMVRIRIISPIIANKIVKPVKDRNDSKPVYPANNILAKKNNLFKLKSFFLKNRN